jgi:CRP/FNR family cyclic AMP-dependent transcriptional regulator
MSKNVLIQSLREIEFLHDMEPEHLDKIANIAHIRDFDENDVVFRQGQAAECLYLVMFGNVSVEVDTPGLGRKEIFTIGPGEIVGWTSLVDRSCYTTWATTPESARLVQLNVADLLRICDRDRDFGYDLMRRTVVALAKRLKKTRQQLVEVYSLAPAPVGWNVVASTAH